MTNAHRMKTIHLLLFAGTLDCIDHNIAIDYFNATVHNDQQIADVDRVIANNPKPEPYLPRFTL